MIVGVPIGPYWHFSLVRRFALQITTSMVSLSASRILLPLHLQVTGFQKFALPGQRLAWGYAHGAMPVDAGEKNTSALQDFECNFLFLKVSL